VGAGFWRRRGGNYSSVPLGFCELVVFENLKYVNVLKSFQEKPWVYATVSSNESTGDAGDP